MAATKKFPTLIVASTMTGVALTKTTFSEMMECASWLCGYPIWTHELAHGPTCYKYRAEGYEQFPGMPTKAEGEADYITAAAKAISTYGESVEVRQGSSKRHEGPMETLSAMAPHADVIPIKIGGDA